LLKWLCEEIKCRWDETTLAAAAMNGHADIVYWAFEKHAPFNEYTCACAARGGQLHILLWLSDNFCPCNHLSYIAARCYNHVGVLDCITENLTKCVMSTRDIETLFGQYDYKQACLTNKTYEDHKPVKIYRERNEYTHVVVPDEAVIEKHRDAVKLILDLNLMTTTFLYEQDEIGIECDFH